MACLLAERKTMTEIAKAANLKRSTAYSTMNGLIEKKRVTVKKNKKTTLYTPQPPEQLLEEQHAQYLNLKNNIHIFSPAKQKNTNNLTNLQETLALHNAPHTQTIFIIINPQEDEALLNSVLTHDTHAPIHIITHAHTKNLTTLKKRIRGTAHHASLIPPNHPIHKQVMIISQAVASFQIQINQYHNLTSPQIAQNLIALCTYCIAAPSTAHIQ
jgi:predicted transcriptional regulator